MKMPWTAAPKEIQRESVKQILNAITIKHLVRCNNTATLNDYHQIRIVLTISLALTLIFQTAEVTVAVCHDEKEVDKFEKS